MEEGGGGLSEHRNNEKIIKVFHNVGHEGHLFMIKLRISWFLVSYCLKYQTRDGKLLLNHVMGNLYSNNLLGKWLKNMLYFSSSSATHSS